MSIAMEHDIERWTAKCKSASLKDLQEAYGEAMRGHYNHLQCRYMLSAYLHNDQETEVACAEQAYLDVGKILSDHFTYHAADCT